MNKIISKINFKYIQDLYNIKYIADNGQVKLNDKTITIYKVDPTSIIDCDEETKHKIYQAYTACIRGLPDVFQILISREQENFKEQIECYNKRLKEIQNEKLKFAIRKYIEYLEEISNVNVLYKINHYLVVQNVNQIEVQEILNILANLKEFGIRITQIESKEQIENILKNYITKG